MSNVINLFDYAVSKNIEKIDDKLDSSEYLRKIKETLDQNDYEEILCGILDIEYYSILETDLKIIVDNYFRTQITEQINA